MAAIADTAYFACLRLPSRQSCSRVRSTELQEHQVQQIPQSCPKNKQNLSFGHHLLHLQSLGIPSRPHISYLSFSEIWSRIEPPALARTWTTPSLIASSLSFSNSSRSPCVPSSKAGKKPANSCKGFQRPSQSLSCSTNVNWNTQCNHKYLMLTETEGQGGEDTKFDESQKNSDVKENLPLAKRGLRQHILYSLTSDWLWDLSGQLWRVLCWREGKSTSWPGS